MRGASGAGGEARGQRQSTGRPGQSHVVSVKFVSYLRVSTARQGASGLGLEAQRAAVAGYLNGGDWTLVQEVLEVESRKRNDRPALAGALKLCRKHRATLVIAKLDSPRPECRLYIEPNAVGSGVCGGRYAAS
jgi:hypothetical protein